MTLVELSQVAAIVVAFITVLGIILGLAIWLISRRVVAGVNTAKDKAQADLILTVTQQRDAAILDKGNLANELQSVKLDLAATKAKLDALRDEVGASKAIESLRLEVARQVQGLTEALQNHEVRSARHESFLARAAKANNELLVEMASTMHIATPLRITDLGETPGPER